jgi:hypothetical protein
LNCLATTGLRARFVRAFENHGEVIRERTDAYRYYDLQPSTVFSALADRLVIEWAGGAVNWAQTGGPALGMPVVEIADPRTEPFLGFDSLLASYDELRAVMAEDRYTQWRTALSSVQGIYLIADTRTGKLSVGKADGVERFLGRWSEYAMNGHGGNVALRALGGADASHAGHFQFCILRVFSPQRAVGPGGRCRNPLQEGSAIARVWSQPELAVASRAMPVDARRVRASGAPSRMRHVAGAAGSSLAGTGSRTHHRRI